MKLCQAASTPYKTLICFQSFEERAVQSPRLGKKHNPLIFYSSSTGFDFGNHSVSHITPKQLHPGGQNFLCPIGLMPEFDHVLSNDIGIFAHIFQRIGTV